MNDLPDPAVVDGVGIGVVPRQQRGIEARDRLLRAAVAEFTDQGIEDSRVERIVERAGTSWGTFFRYFPRKEDVYLVEAARHFRERMRPVYDRAFSDSSIPVASSLRDLFVQLTDTDHTPRFHAEMIREAVQHPARLAAILGEGEIPLASLVGNLVQLGQERGEIRADVPAPLAGMVIAAGTMFSVSFALTAVASGSLPESEVGRIREQVFDLAWSGLSPSIEAGKPGTTD